MNMIYVRPALGGRIRMPERNFEPMSPAGAFVPRDGFYERLLLGGDILEIEPPSATSCNPESAATATLDSAGSRAASPKEEN